MNSKQNTRKKILLSCFTATPLLGSEPGIGWKWAIALSEMHDVTLLTNECYRKDIESFLYAENSHLKVLYHKSFTMGFHPDKYMNSKLYYLVWQITVLFYVRKILAQNNFDLIHHLTWGSYRLPTFLGLLNIPFVIGPVGGGETAPSRMYFGLPIRVQAKEFLRALLVRASKLDPLCIIGPLTAKLVFVKTEETYKCYPDFVKKKCLLQSEVGIASSPISLDLIEEIFDAEYNKPLVVLYAGNLIGLKGVHLILKSIVLLKKYNSSIKFIFAGDGPLKTNFEEFLQENAIDGNVNFTGKLAKSELNKLYESCDVLLFPSLHDSSGNVVMEAASYGTPTICLDLGGPKYLVGEGAGVIVSTQNRSQREVIEGICVALIALDKDRRLLKQKSIAALEHAQKTTWSNQVSCAYEKISSQLEWK